MTPEELAAIRERDAQDWPGITDGVVDRHALLAEVDRLLDRDPRTLDALSETVARMKVERDAALAEVDRLQHKLGPNLLGPDMSTARRVE